MKTSFRRSLGISAGVLLLMILIGLFAGPVLINPLRSSELAGFILFRLRLPRILLAALAGAMLSLSGTSLQCVLRNKLADPYILGISAGGGIGAGIAIILSLPYFLVSLLAFVCSLAAVFAVYTISRIGGRVRPETLILSGVAVSSFLGALLTFMAVTSDKLQSVYFWMLGSFSGATWLDVRLAFAVTVAGLAVMIALSRKMNILLLGEEEAISLGLDVNTLRVVLLVTASLLAGVSVSLCGMIGFVGLVVPHIVRSMTGQNNLFVIPLAAVFGALILVASDTIARTVVMPGEVPVGIITAIVGAPYFLYLLRSKGSIK